MDGLITCCQNWPLSTTKEVKLITTRTPRIIFRYKKKNGVKRGVSISEEAFTQLASLTNVPQNGCNYDAVQTYKLDSQVDLKCYGNCTKLARYCTSRDNKQVDGSFIILDAKEWLQLLEVMDQIMKELQK